MLPQINQMIYLKYVGDEDFRYKSRVADFSKKTFSIEIPFDMKTGNFKSFDEGRFVDIWYTTSAGRFSFSTKILGSRIEHIPLLILEKPEEIKRTQLRSFLRVSTTVEMSFRKRNVKNDVWHVVRTIDISGGGLQFILPLPDTIDLDQVIEGWIVLPFPKKRIEHIRFAGVVVRVLKPKDDVKVHWVSVEYDYLKENMREHIIRFCYQKQVEQRKKSRG